MSVGGIAVCAPISQDADVPRWRCRVRFVGGMLDRRRAHVQRMGGTCDSEDCVDVQKILYTVKDFDLVGTKQKGREVSQKNLTVVFTPIHSKKRH